MPTSFARKLPFVLILAAIAFTLVAPLVVSAQTTPDIGSPQLPKLLPGDLGDQLLVCTGVPTANEPNDYCHDVCDLVYQIIWIVYLAITWVLWVIAPISFIAGGIMYMLAGADPGMAGTAKKVLTGAVIGVAIVLCSYLIINTFVVFFNITGVGGFNGTTACTIQ